MNSEWSKEIRIATISTILLKNRSTTLTVSGLTGRNAYAIYQTLSDKSITSHSFLFRLVGKQHINRKKCSVLPNADSEASNKTLEKSVNARLDLTTTTKIQVEFVKHDCIIYV